MPCKFLLPSRFCYAGHLDTHCLSSSHDIQPFVEGHLRLQGLAERGRALFLYEFRYLSLTTITSCIRPWKDFMGSLAARQCPAQPTSIVRRLQSSLCHALSAQSRSHRVQIYQIACLALASTATQASQQPHARKTHSVLSAHISRSNVQKALWPASVLQSSTIAWY
jgi:hypothetical protein